MDFVSIFVILVAIFAGVALKFAFDAAVKAKALSLANAAAGEKGRKARQEQEGELMALLTEASMAFKAGKEAGEDVKDTAARVVPALIAKYPTVIMKHGKKLLKIINENGDLGFLEGLI